MNDPTPTRKRKWEYIPAAKTKWNDPKSRPSIWVQHPANGTNVFGTLPPIIHAGRTVFSGGEIVLKYGKHVGNEHQSKGFYGFLHIWARRFSWIDKHEDAMTAVCNFVAGIVRPGSEIYWDVDDRVAIFSNINGEVIVEEKNPDGGPLHYSIVTAIGHPVKAKGSRMGALA